MVVLPGVTPALSTVMAALELMSPKVTTSLLITALGAPLFNQGVLPANVFQTPLGVPFQVRMLPMLSAVNVKLSIASAASMLASFTSFQRRKRFCPGAQAMPLMVKDLCFWLA